MELRPEDFDESDVVYRLMARGQQVWNTGGHLSTNALCREAAQEIVRLRNLCAPQCADSERSKNNSG